MAMINMSSLLFQDNDLFWWFTPNVGMVVAVVIGIFTLGYALFKMRRWMSSQDVERCK